MAEEDQSKFGYYRAAEGILYVAVKRFLNGDPRAFSTAEAVIGWCDATGDHTPVEDTPFDKPKCEKCRDVGFFVKANTSLGGTGVGGQMMSSERCTCEMGERFKALK